MDSCYEREPLVYNPEETAKVEIIQRSNLMRQFARIDNVTDSVQNSGPLFALKLDCNNFFDLYPIK